MTESEEFLRQVVETLPADKLSKAAKRTAWKIQVFILMHVTMIIAGIWVDWRWFLTSFIPIGFAVYYSYLAKVLREDAVRRINEFKAAQGG